MISFNIHDDIQIFHWSLNLFFFFKNRRIITIRARRYFTFCTIYNLPIIQL